MSALQLEQRDFKQFVNIFYKQSGIGLPDEKKMLVIARVSKRLRYHGIDDFHQYAQFIESDEGQSEVQALIDCLTTNETYFFREEKHFQFLAKTVHDDKIFMRRPLRLWSAACSSGQEAYSIAMTLMEKNVFSFEVFATDINTEVLRKGKDAVYDEVEISRIPEAMLKRYWLQGTGVYEKKVKACPDLRHKVCFSHINLSQNLPNIGSFQVIFLRNILIYFQPEHKDAILVRLLSRLASGGYLIVGHSEAIINAKSFGLESIEPSIYRKK